MKRRPANRSPLCPNAALDDYTRTGAGVILNEDLPNNTLVYAKQELVKRPWGPEKYGG